MNTQQIEHCLTKNPYTKKIINGVYAADLLPSLDKIVKPLLIANTRESSHEGEHWISFFVNEKRRLLEIFDSSGQLTPNNNKHFSVYLSKNFKGMRVKYNTRCVQHLFSNICGVYCIVYALYRAKNVSFEKFLQMFDLKDTYGNDKKVMSIFKKHFNSCYGKLENKNECKQISQNLYLCKHNKRKRK